MAKKSASQYALLGLLSWEPMSGYDIKKHFDTFLKFLWSESYGHIYPTLKRLLGKGLVTKHVERQAGKPDRLVYTITRAGRKEFYAWYQQPVPPPRIRSELLLRLYFGENIPMSVHIEMVKTLYHGLIQVKPLFAASEKTFKENSTKSERDFLAYLTFLQGYHLFKCRLKWCQEALEIIEKRPQGPKKKKSRP